MQTQMEKTQEQQGATAPRVTKEPSTGGTATIVDNRPATIYQRKLMETMNTYTALKNPPIQQKAPKGSSRFQQIAMAMGEKHGVDTSGLIATHNSSFPTRLNAEATIQGRKIHFAPGMDTDYNIRHEVAHAIDNTLHGTPKGDKVMNGQKIDTTREKVVDRMAKEPMIQRKVKTSLPVIQKKEDRLKQRGQNTDVIQRVRTKYGEFTTDQYTDRIENDGYDILVGCDIQLKFTPYTKLLPFLRGKRIAFIQTVTSLRGGHFDPTGKEGLDVALHNQSGRDTVIDRDAGINGISSPVYGVDDLVENMAESRPELDTYWTDGDYNQSGGVSFAKLLSKRIINKVPVQLDDSPLRYYQPNVAQSQVFETVAVVLDNNNRRFLGSVEWGWRKPANTQITGNVGAFTATPQIQLLPLRVVENAGASDDFINAVEDWNALGKYDEQDLVQIPN